MIKNQIVTLKGNKTKKFIEECCDFITKDYIEDLLEDLKNESFIVLFEPFDLGASIIEMPSKKDIEKAIKAVAKKEDGAEGPIYYAIYFGEDGSPNEMWINTEFYEKTDCFIK